MPPPSKRAKLAHQINVPGKKGFQSNALPEAPWNEVDNQSEDEFSEEELQEITKRLAEGLKWRAAGTAELPGKAAYTGESERSQRRKAAEKRARSESMGGSKTLLSYFSSPFPVKSQESDDVAAESKFTIAEALDKLDEECAGKSLAANEGVMAYDNSRLLTLRVYFSRIFKGEQKIPVSVDLAETMWRKGDHHARRIREWGNEYLETGELSHHRQGAHTKIKPLKDDEDFSGVCKAWLRLAKPEHRSPLALKEFAEREVLPGMANSRKTISESTCREYMKEWGYSFGTHSKDVYMDGHEREDVVEYRAGFVGRILELEARMSSFEGDDMHEVEPKLGVNEKKVVMVTHDECAFHSYDAQGRLWLGEGEQILRKKGAGKTLMVSGFMCPCHGVVDLKSFEPGKNSDGYWTSAHMVEHVS